MDTLTELIAAIDRRRREACNIKTYSEGSSMYYEGMRVGLQEIQDYAEKLKALNKPC